MPEATIEPTPLVWMGHYDDLPENTSHYKEREIGWAYFTRYSGRGPNSMLSNYYHDNVASLRLPICVMCPALSSEGKLYATPFWIDSYPNGEGQNANNHWTVTVDLESLIVGQKPLITVNPSIHLIGVWHGWLQDGILHQ